MITGKGAKGGERRRGKKKSMLRSTNLYGVYSFCFFGLPFFMLPVTCLLPCLRPWSIIPQPRLQVLRGLGADKLPYPGRPGGVEAPGVVTRYLREKGLRLVVAVAAREEEPRPRPAGRFLVGPAPALRLLDGALVPLHDPDVACAYALEHASPGTPRFPRRLLVHRPDAQLRGGYAVDVEVVGRRGALPAVADGQLARPLTCDALEDVAGPRRFRGDGFDLVLGAESQVVTAAAVAKVDAREVAARAADVARPPQLGARLPGDEALDEQGRQREEVALGVLLVADDGVAVLADGDAARGAEGGRLRDEAGRGDAVLPVVHAACRYGWVVRDLLADQVRGGCRRPLPASAAAAVELAEEDLAEEGVQGLLALLVGALADEGLEAADVVAGHEGGAAAGLGLAGRPQEEVVARGPGRGDLEGGLGGEDEGRRRHVGQVALHGAQVG